MLFNSLDFAVFLPLVFAGYWMLGGARRREQNFWLLLVSYVFYGWWDWRFLGLIALSSAVDYWVGLRLAERPGRARGRRLLGVSLALNLGTLATFKYFDFFAASFAGAFTLLGRPFEPWQLGWVLPVGISFYTFQTLSYTIDVYRGRAEPTRDAVAFFAFVSFFPQLVAGPIERASHLLPQFLRERRFSYPRAVLGLRQVLWGLVKKMVVADNCARVVNDIWANYETASGGYLLLATTLFAFQIYGDFSGYSDIAIGTSRLFGFDLRRNFAYPYFARNVAEFWRRWHISLSTWFRDYVYVPLGGSRAGRGRQLLAVWAVFLLSGFWHGANWTFLLWGALHALLYCGNLLAGTARRYRGTVAAGRRAPGPREALRMAGTFLAVTLAWVPFRAASLPECLIIYGRIFDPGSWGGTSVASLGQLGFALLAVGFVLLVEWAGRGQDFALANWPDRLPRPVRYAGYALLAAATLLYSVTDRTPFIYFQF